MWINDSISSIAKSVWSENWWITYVIVHSSNLLKFLKHLSALIRLWGSHCSPKSEGSNYLWRNYLKTGNILNLTGLYNLSGEKWMIPIEPPGLILACSHSACRKRHMNLNSLTTPTAFTCPTSKSVEFESMRARSALPQWTFNFSIPCQMISIKALKFGNVPFCLCKEYNILCSLMAGKETVSS